MNVSLYICLLAGIGLSFYLVTYGSALSSSACFSSMSLTTQILSGTFTFGSFLSMIMANIGFVAGVLLIGMFGILALGYGAMALVSIIWNILLFFVIPNLFVLPTFGLLSGMCGLPDIVSYLIIFGMNLILLLTAIEFLR